MLFRATLALAAVSCGSDRAPRAPRHVGPTHVVADAAPLVGAEGADAGAATLAEPDAGPPLLPCIANARWDGMACTGATVACDGRKHWNGNACVELVLAPPRAEAALLAAYEGTKDPVVRLRAAYEIAHVAGRSDALLWCRRAVEAYHAANVVDWKIRGTVLADLGAEAAYALYDEEIRSKLHEDRPLRFGGDIDGVMKQIGDVKRVVDALDVRASHLYTMFASLEWGPFTLVRAGMMWIALRTAIEAASPRMSAQVAAMVRKLDTTGRQEDGDMVRADFEDAWSKKRSRELDWADLHALASFMSAILLARAYGVVGPPLDKARATVRDLEQKIGADKIRALAASVGDATDPTQERRITYRAELVR